MAIVFIGLGTNLGSRRQNLAEAHNLLPPNVNILKESSIHETAPWGYADQPNFLNQVLHCESILQPLELLAHLKSIEEKLGRTPTFRYGPRLIDLDLIAYDQLVLESPRLKIPHPRMQDRRFVLEPMVEIAPNWIHPFLNKSAFELLTELENKSAA